MATRKPAPRTSLITRTTCRICGCPHLAPVLSLGDQRIAGAFADPGGAQPVERAIPMELVRCDMTQDQEACGLIQTKHTVPGSILYSSYWYRSGVNRTMTENLHGIARGVEAIVPLESGDLVVDIGCNDGTLLDGYQAQGLRHLGFDPSDVARYAIAKGYDVVNDFYSAEALRQRRPDQKAKAITSIAMFYDLEYPRAFVADVAEALAEQGIWVMELHYLPMMLEANAFDAIVHEHLEYYSLAVIERLVGEEGLEVVSAELNDMNGGSIRLFIGHAGRHERTPEQQDALERRCASTSSSWRLTRLSPTSSSASAPSESATSCSPSARSCTAKARRSTSTAPPRRATRSFSTPASTAPWSRRRPTATQTSGARRRSPRKSRSSARRTRAR